MQPTKIQKSNWWTYEKKTHINIWNRGNYSFSVCFLIWAAPEYFCNKRYVKRLTMCVVHPNLNIANQSIWDEWTISWHSSSILGSKCLMHVHSNLERIEEYAKQCERISDDARNWKTKQIVYYQHKRTQRNNITFIFKFPCTGWGRILRRRSKANSLLKWSHTFWFGMLSFERSMISVINR